MKLKKIVRNYREEVVKNFDLSDPQDSFWIQCNNEYAGPPQNIEEQEEFNGSIRKQTKLAMKHWQYFSNCPQKDFQGLLKYVIWLRTNHSNNEQHYVYQHQVSDHIYEM